MVTVEKPPEDIAAIAERLGGPHAYSCGSARLGRPCTCTRRGRVKEIEAALTQVAERAAEAERVRYGWIPEDELGLPALHEELSALKAKLAQAEKESAREKREAFTNGKEWMKQGNDYVQGWRDGAAAAFDALGERRDERLMVLTRGGPQFMREKAYPDPDPDPKPDGGSE